MSVLTSSTPETPSATESRTASPGESASAPKSARAASAPPLAAARPAQTPWPRSGIIGLALAALVTVIVLAFSWPAVASAPHALPVDLVGSEPAVEQVRQALQSEDSDVFSPAVATDRDAAVRRIERRESYGAIVLGPEPEVLTSSAASPAVSQLLNGIAGKLQARLSQQAPSTGSPAPVVASTDIVPLLDTDPRGAGLAAAAFPLVLGGMLGGIVISIAVRGTRRRIVALLVYSAAAGLAVAGVMQGGFQVLAGDYLANAGAFGLSLLSIGAPIVGAVSLVGRAGIAVGPVLFLLIANPIASASTPKEFLPGSWGEIGQWFPPGAGATLIRNLSYFPEASSGLPWLVLLVWAGAGVLLASCAGTLRARAGERRRLARPAA